MVTRCFGLLVLAVLVTGSACTGDAGPPGADGADGKDGADGMNGEAGPEGAHGRDGSGAVASILCQGSVTREVDGSLVYGLVYDVIEYAGGDVFVSCSVEDGFSTSTSTNYYDNTQNGALNLSCLVSADVENGTFGWWEFTTENGVATAKYNDGDSVNDGTVFTFDGADATHGGCTTRDLQ